MFKGKYRVKIKFFLGINIKAELQIVQSSQRNYFYWPSILKKLDAPLIAYEEHEHTFVKFQLNDDTQHQHLKYDHFIHNTNI